MRRLLPVLAGSLALLGPAAADARTAPARVFLPNPVQSLRDESLTDRNDADYPALQKAYREVSLTDLDGSGSLTGTYAKVLSSTGKAAQDTGAGFRYARDDDRFEQVMAYQWVTQAQHYLQALRLRRPANARQQLLRINQYGGDNSFYREGSSKLTITLGKGGVDDAEDGEVIVHEYGHSVQDDQVPGFGTSPEAGAIGEAFGDYLAVEVSTWATGNRFEVPCVADWDSVSYTAGPIHCLRRVDGTKHYPEDVEGEVHADGELWSAALWQARQAIGDPIVADSIIVDAQFDFTPGISFRDAALKTIAAAGANSKAAAAFRRAFSARGFL